MVNLKQPRLFPASRKTEVYLKEDHELTQITELVDWDELILISNSHELQICKSKKRSGATTKIPGTVVLKSLKGFDYRMAKDFIAHYVPARYLCDLMDSSWQPDHVIIFDFTKMLGQEGMESINQIFLPQGI